MSRVPCHASLGLVKGPKDQLARSDHLVVWSFDVQWTRDNGRVTRDIREAQETLLQCALNNQRKLPRPKAVLFDLFHTLVCVPPPALVGHLPIPEILGVCSDEWQRRYYDEDVIGRCVGKVHDSVEAMRLVTHSIDPTIEEARILTAVESRRRRFEMGLIEVEDSMLTALDRLRREGIRTAIVSDAGADDVESWSLSPLAQRVDATIFSYHVGYRKPDPRIYQDALNALDVAAKDAIFVGDGGSDEHNGARALGMGTVLVTRLYSLWWPERIEARRPYADWEFGDVAGFVEALFAKTD
jgi:putative hydrolase of the HAD superfamily